MQLVLRDYKIADYNAIKQILKEGGLYDSSWDDEQQLKNRITEKPDTIVVAQVGNDVVGCVYIIDDVLPFLFRLAVKNSFRKNGIGTQLLQEAIKRMKKHGKTEVAIFVDDKNEELKQWYRKQDFEDAGTWHCMWKKI